MKTISSILIIFLVFPAFAEDKAPGQFEDSAIKRTLKNGKIQKFDGNQYKIVPRNSKSKEIKPEIKKNRISLLAGKAPSGDIRISGNKAISPRETILGISYQRSLNDNFSVGIQIQSNETVLGSVGVDF